MNSKDWLRITSVAIVTLTFFGLPVFIAPNVSPLNVEGHTHAGYANAIPSETTPPLPAQITYTLDWDWGKASPGGAGWRVTNNLGYHIRVEQGYLVTRSVELIACELDHSLSQIIFDALPQPAYAGHGVTGHDLSRISVPQVESLTAPTAVTVVSTFGSEPAYCQAHYLLAPAIETASNLPGQTDMLDVTLFIRGTYTAPTGHPPTPFTITTQLAWGALVDLPQAVPTPRQAMQITIRRNLGSMFDNLDFSRMSEAEQAQTILRSLVASTQIEVLP